MKSNVPRYASICSVLTSLALMAAAQTSFAFKGAPGKRGARLNRSPHQLRLVAGKDSRVQKSFSFRQHGLAKSSSYYTGKTGNTSESHALIAPGKLKVLDTSSSASGGMYRSQNHSFQFGPYRLSTRSGRVRPSDNPRASFSLTFKGRPVTRVKTLAGAVSYINRRLDRFGFGEPSQPANQPARGSATRGGTGYVNMETRGAGFSGSTGAEGYSRLLGAGFKHIK